MSFARASALCQVSICSFRRTQVRGEMKSEIFLYGHFFYGHRLGRYVRPDDLNKRRSKKTGAIRLLFAFGDLTIG